MNTARKLRGLHYSINAKGGGEWSPKEGWDRVESDAFARDYEQVYGDRLPRPLEDMNAFSEGVDRAFADSAGFKHLRSERASGCCIGCNMSWKADNVRHYLTTAEGEAMSKGHAELRGVCCPLEIAARVKGESDSLEGRVPDRVMAMVREDSDRLVMKYRQKMAKSRARGPGAPTLCDSVISKVKGALAWI